MEPNYGYKHTRGFIVFLIIIFCGWVIVAHSQVSNTGNLVGSTWSNGYSVPELTCWQAGDPNCSPGTPYVRPPSANGNINFSYAATELYQTRTLTDVLPYSGTGLMVTGYQYNWRSKNGNGWDDGRLDVLQAYVQMYSKSGQWIESQTYSLNYLHNWTDFAWSGTFSKERRGSDLGTILYGFYGKDNNYWVGPYGPEITNVSFSLRYQPDPCVVNPLHSTDCPGFLKTIASPAYQAQESSAAITPIVAATTSSAPSMSLPAMTSSVIKLTSRQEQFAQETETAGTSSSLVVINKNSNSVTDTGLPTMSTASARLNSRQEQSNQDIDSTAVVSNSSTSSLMSLDKQTATPVTVARVRTGSADSTDSSVTIDSASEQTVVTQTATTGTLAQNISNQTRSNQARDNSTRSDSASETVTLDQSLIVMPQTTSTTTVTTVSTLPVQPRSTTQTVTTDNDTSASTQISLFRAPEPVTLNQLDNQVNYSLLEPIRQSIEQQPVSIPSIAILTPQQAIQTLEPITTQEPLRPQTIELPIEIQTNTIAGALIDKTNPLNDVLNGQPLLMQTSTSFAGPSVNTTIADNDLAGGVNINQIARVPVGFDVYTNLAIREIAFYQPKEIYRGQRTVDNVRALRSLGQDARHQQMVDQQYLPR